MESVRKPYETNWEIKPLIGTVDDALGNNPEIVVLALPCLLIDEQDVIHRLLQASCLFYSYVKMHQRRMGKRE